MPGHDAHDHGHSHSGADLASAHARAHVHHHAPASPHPPQPAPWSILRMTLAARLGAAIAASAALWAFVLIAMR
jgi:hypothetical protein